MVRVSSSPNEGPTENGTGRHLFIYPQEGSGCLPFSVSPVPGLAEVCEGGSFQKLFSDRQLSFLDELCLGRFRCKPKKHVSKVYKSLCVQRYRALNIGVNPNTVLQIVPYFECCTMNASTLCSTPTLTTSYKRTEHSSNSSQSEMLLHSFFTTPVTKQEARVAIYVICEIMFLSQQKY